MKAFVITLVGNTYSEKVADRCINSAKKYGVNVLKFPGVPKETAKETMLEHGLEWTWAHNNTKPNTCAITGLYQFPYTAQHTTLASLDAKIGCSMSHFLMWQLCIAHDEPILILEHDSVFLRALPEIDFHGICQINDPAGATRKGSWWSQKMKRRGTVGAHEKTWVTTPNERNIPDGLAGHSAYLIKPWAAQQAVDRFYELGVWPNDAMMCKQLFPYLQEYYPFITKVQQSESTSTR